MEHILRFSHPAGDYKNGLPIGNGRLAAMVCGDEKSIRVALNHEWLWRGTHRFRDCRDVSSHLPEVREALFSGDLLTGTRLANDYFGGTPGEGYRIDPYQPAGDLIFAVKGGDRKRTLDLSSGEVRVTAGDTEFRAFASFADGFIVARISGDVELSLGRAEDEECELKTEGLRLCGVFRGGVSFEVRAKTYPAAEYTTVLVDIAVSANGGTLLPFPADADYDALFARHLPEFRKALGNAEIELDTPESGLDTDERLKRFKAGDDPSLPVLYFEYGRYLLASGSSGELPLNLQGKWSEDIRPAWECDYHLNVNLQMAYWPAAALGMGKQEDPLFTFCERCVPYAREAARKLYGCRGVCFPLQTDSSCRTTPESTGWCVWIGAAAWLASHFTRRWRYEKDETFLKNRAYPFLKEVAAFYEDYLVLREDGLYHIAPSQSPENKFEGTGDYAVSILVDSAMDIELAAETLNACIEMSVSLGVDGDLRKKWSDILARLPALTTDSKGRLNEFDKERVETEPGHRHLSHLYGLYPGELFPQGHPLRRAAEISLDYRLSHGGAYTGWSRAWTACIMARLGRAEDCYKHLTALICDFATESLLDLHPPRIFQIDGNMGGCAAVCEMLLSAEGGTVTLLGALPEEWGSGSFRHLKAPGTLDVSCVWKDGRAETIELRAEQAGTWTLRTGGKEYAVALSQGETKTLAI